MTFLLPSQVQVILVLPSLWRPALTLLNTRSLLVVRQDVVASSTMT